MEPIIYLDKRGDTGYIVVKTSLQIKLKGILFGS